LVRGELMGQRVGEQGRACGERDFDGSVAFGG
jgi:hypothetical protein